MDFWRAQLVQWFYPHAASAIYRLLISNGRGEQTKISCLHKVKRTMHCCSASWQFIGGVGFVYRVQRSHRARENGPGSYDPGGYDPGGCKHRKLNKYSKLLAHRTPSWWWWHNWVEQSFNIRLTTLPSSFSLVVQALTYTRTREAFPVPLVLTGWSEGISLGGSNSVCLCVGVIRRWFGGKFRWIVSDTCTSVF